MRPHPKLAAIIPVVIGILLTSCQDVEKITSEERVKVLIDRCVELNHPAFLIAVSEKSESGKVVEFILSPPGTTLTPFSVAEYRAAKSPQGRLARVRGVFQPGERLRIVNVWIIDHFEGDIAVFEARTPTIEHIDISSIVTISAVLSVLNGDPLTDSEGSRILDKRFAKFCD